MTNFPTNGQKRKKKLLKPSQVKDLFARFQGIWGSDWTWRVEGNPARAAKEWAEVLGGFSQSQINHAVEVARAKHKKPVSPADFQELCGHASDGTLISFADALEMAEVTIRKKKLIKKPVDLAFEQELLIILRRKIHRDQNDKADIMICGQCRNYIIVDFGSELDWYCDEHKDK